MIPAYVLHTRQYRDTSLIIEFFTKEQGRVGAIAKGARRPRSKLKFLSQPFIPLLVNLIGKSDLKTITDLESDHPSALLTGKYILTGFYLNELIMRLLQRQDPHPELFNMYHHTLNALSQQQDSEIALRLFEKTLLKELGYELQLDKDRESGQPICRESYYAFVQGVGFTKCLKDANQAHIFSGETLLALHIQDFTEKKTLTESKRLMRAALTPLLGNKPIKSRELYYISKETV